MNSTQKSHYRALLDSKMEEVCRDYASVGSRLRHLYDDPDNFDVDLNSTAEAEDVLCWVSARDREQFAALRDALARLEAGVYGRCAHCGVDIAPARLEVMPAATSCLLCQERIEDGRIDPDVFLGEGDLGLTA